MSDKYFWSSEFNISSLEALPSIETHSVKKHELVYNYIVKYVKTVMANPNIPALSLSIVDGFAGGGAYQYKEQLHYGSPVVILQALEEANMEININREKPRHIYHQLFFVEKDKNAASFLENTIKNLKYKINTSGINFHQGDFNLYLPSIIEKIQKHNKAQRAIFILDQYAYKDVPIRNIQKIFSKLKNPEVILTFNIGSLVTFLTDDISHKTALNRLGLANSFPWEEFREYKDSEYRNAFIQFHITKAILSASGARFITPFFFSRETPNGKGRHGYHYWLVHLSNTYRANDVMKSLHWDMKNDFCHSLNLGIFGYNTNHDNQKSTQKLLNFGEEHTFNRISEEKSIELLTTEIGRKIHDLGKSVPLNKVLNETANVTMANELIIKKMLEQSIQIGDLTVVDKTEQKKRLSHRTIKTTDIIIPDKQKKLFLP